MRYGIHTRLRKGRRISLFNTLRCPLQCSYCSLRTGNKCLPFIENKKTKENNLTEWELLLLNLFRFMPIREIYITGGEPTLRDDVSDLINFLLGEDKCVTMHSTLWTDNAMNIIKTDKFRILSTFHRDDNKERYIKNLNQYQSKYRVDVTEIGKQQLSMSTVKPFELQGEGIAGQTERFAISPDGHIFVRMGMFYKHMGII